MDMDLYVYDYDAQFSRYMTKWMRENADLYQTLEEMEGALEDVYALWLTLPAKWLNGQKPGEYFAQFTDPALLVRYMEKYINAGVQVPEAMLAAIAALDQPAAPELMRLMQGESAIITNEKKLADATGLCINLLHEIGAQLPMERYIRAILDNPEGEFCEGMTEALCGMGKDVVEPVLNAVEAGAPEQALGWFLTVLVEHPGDERIARALKNAYVNAARDKGLFAAFIGKYGDETLAPVLEDALRHQDMEYLDWIETRNALEELGGQFDMAEPDFSGDPYFEALRGMGEEDSHG